MPQQPPLVGSFDPTTFESPRAFAYVNGIFIPVKQLSVEQTAYASADAAHITTFLYDLGINLGALSQQQKYVPVNITVGNSTNPPAYGGKSYAPLYYGFLEELDADWGADSYTVSSRGILAILIDQRISQRIDMNVDIGDAITALIKKYGYGMTTQIGKAGVPVGKVLTADYVSIARNVRVFDLIQVLAQGVGWTMRTKGTTVIVGPPPVVPTTQLATTQAISAGSVNAPVFVKQWQGPGIGGGTGLTIKHNAMHSHNIKVKVVSYVNKSKGASSGESSDQGQSAALLGMPAPTASTSSTPGGRQVGTTSVGEGATNDEEYIFHIPGLTAAKCITTANLIRDEISRHEFIAELTFVPTASELLTLVQASPEFAVYLTGEALHKQGHDQVYFPRRITWNYAVDAGSGGGGLTVSMLMVNHPVPQPTGGE